MNRFLTFFIIIFFIEGFGQNLEMDAELIELNFQYSSDPTDFFHFQNQLFFRGKYKGLDDYSIFKYDGIDAVIMKNSEGKRVESDKPSAGDNLLYFYGSTNPYVDGNNLWVSDGTENSATPILETDWIPQDRFIIGDRLYFTIYGSTTKELWTSNGTFDGTFKLKELYWNPNSSYSFDYLTECQGKLFFITDSPIFGKELWVSDGSINGTYIVKDIHEGTQSSNITSIFSFNEKIYFVANDGVNGYELWTSDGTNGGTYILKDINPGSNNALNQFDNQFIEFDGNFYFFANDGTNVQLWKSNGTTDGTIFYKSVNTFQYNNSYQTASINGDATDHYFVFKAYDYNSSNHQYIEKLWKSDGTIEGTLELLELNSNYSPFSNSQFDRIQNKIYFSQESSTYPNQELWVTDGTTTGSMIVVEAYREYSGFKMADDYVFLKAKIDHSEDEILKIDYSTNNYSIFLDNVINPERGFGIYNDEIYFGFDYNHNNNYHPKGGELWKADFNGSNPELVKDINLSGSSNPVNFNKINDDFVFYANNGQETGLFISNELGEGIHLLKEIQIETSNGSNETKFYKVGNQYLFRARHNEEFAPYLLFKTDGTPSGTTQVSSIVSPYFANHKQTFEIHNEKLYFIGGEPGSDNRGLWVSDGSESGTYNVYDFSNENINYILFNSIQSFGDYVYFTISINYNDGSVSRGLWKTDGTTEGTELIYEVNHEYWHENHAPFILGVINDKLVFQVSKKHYSGFPNSFIEVFALEQNSQTPELIYTIDGKPYPGPYEINKSIYFQNLIYMPMMMYNSSNNLKMTFLKTDGTADGTYIIGATQTIGMFDLEVCGNYLYFNETFSSNYQLWRTDGTNNGTIKLREIPNTYSHIDDSVCHKDNFYYSPLSYTDLGDGHIDVKGTLEVTNGQANQHQEVLLNRIDNDPIREINNLFSDGNLLYMTISENIHGNELYVSNPDFVLTTEEINEGLTKDNSNVLIYPNPTSSEINVVSNDQSQIKQIQLYDLTGKLMEIGIYNAEEVKLNLNKYNSGIYLLKVQTEKNTITKKVILK